MSENKASCIGCTGCLGSLVILTFIGSIFFGGGVLLKVGGLSFVLGNPVDRTQIINDYSSGFHNSKKLAEEGVQKFHTQLKQGKCQDIYDQASEILKKSVGELDIAGLCGKLKQDIGSVNSAQLIDWWSQSTNNESEHYILLRYISTSSKSIPVREIFVWLVKPGKTELISFEINPQIVK
jgi:hypothetical protein